MRGGGLDKSIVRLTEEQDQHIKSDNSVERVQKLCLFNRNLPYCSHRQLCSFEIKHL